MVYKEITTGEDMLARAKAEQSTLLAIRASYYLFAEGKYDQGIEALKRNWLPQSQPPESDPKFIRECKESKLMESGRLQGVIAVLEKLYVEDSKIPDEDARKAVAEMNAAEAAKMLIVKGAELADKGDFSPLFRKPTIKAALDNFTPAVGEPYGMILKMYLKDQPRALRVAASSANPESPQYRE